MNIRRSETTLIAVAILLMATASYQLFVRPGGADAQLGWQAWLSQLENSAKHRSVGDLVWRDLHQGDHLAAGASIFTGDQARAGLQFRSGQQVTMAPNTLLRLQQEQTVDKILLEQGMVQTTLGSETLELQLRGKKVQLTGKGAEVLITPTSLSVMAGDASLQSGDTRLLVGAHEEVRMGEAAPVKTKLQMQLEQPREGALVWTLGEPKVDLRWKNLTELPVRLEIARDLDFKDLVKTLTTTDSQVNVNLVAGSFYWKVSNELGTSRVGTFSLKREPALELVAPEGTVVLPLGDETKTARLTLEWKSTQVKRYHVSWTVKGKTTEIESEHHQLPIDVPVDEAVRWGVKPLDEARPLAQKSAAGEFVVKRLAVPPAPLWVTASPLELSRDSENQRADLKWAGSAAEYEFEVRQANDVKSNGAQTASELVFPNLAAGSYQVRVRGVDEYGRSGLWSKDLVVKWTPFEERKPEEGQRIILERPDQKISFEWDGKGEQIFELADDETFKNIILTQKGTGSTEIIFPKVGTFYWRARQVDGGFSRPKKVQVEPSPPLATPGAPPSLKKEIEIQFIEPKSSWIDWIIPRAFASEVVTRVLLELPAEESAVAYHVEIFSDKALTKKIFTTTTKENQFEWKGAKPGKYWWRYALRDAWGRETAMGPASELRLLPGDAEDPAKPKLASPIRAVELKEAPETTFVWKRAARALDYVVEVARDDAFEEPLAQVEEKETRLTLSNTGWPRGDVLFWRVRARHDWGETASNTGRFQIGAKAVLSEEQKKALPWREANAYSWLRLGLEPRQVAVELDDQEYNGKIEGNALNSISVAGRVLLSKHWALRAEVLRQSGQVFDGEVYSRTDMVILPEWQQRWGENTFVFVGLGLQRVSGSTYKLKTPESLAFEEVSATSPRAQVELEWRLGEKSSLHTQLGAAFGDWSVFDGQCVWRRFWRRGLFHEAGLSYEQATLKAPRGDNKLSGMGLAARLGVAF